MHRTLTWGSPPVGKTADALMILSDVWVRGRGGGGGVKAGGGISAGKSPVSTPAPSPSAELLDSECDMPAAGANRVLTWRFLDLLLD